MTNLDRYNDYTKAADANDLRNFNNHLIGGLLTAVDEATATAMLDAAAAFVNRVSA